MVVHLLFDFFFFFLSLTCRASRREKLAIYQSFDLDMVESNGTTCKGSQEGKEKKRKKKGILWNLRLVKLWRRKRRSLVQQSRRAGLLPFDLFHLYPETIVTSANGRLGQNRAPTNQQIACDITNVSPFRCLRANI